MDAGCSLVTLEDAGFWVLSGSLQYSVHRFSTEVRCGKVIIALFDDWRFVLTCFGFLVYVTELLFDAIFLSCLHPFPDPAHYLRQRAFFYYYYSSAFQTLLWMLKYHLLDVLSEGIYITINHIESDKFTFYPGLQNFSNVLVLQLPQIIMSSEVGCVAFLFFFNLGSFRQGCYCCLCMGWICPCFDFVDAGFKTTRQ